MIIKINPLRQIVILIISFLVLSGCSNTNHTKTDKKILDYESAGSAMSALSVGSPSAAVLFLAIDLMKKDLKRYKLRGLVKLTL